MRVDFDVRRPNEMDFFSIEDVLLWIMDLCFGKKQQWKI